MNRTMKFIPLLLCGLLAGGVVDGADKGKKDKKKQTTVQQDSVKPAVKKGIPSIADFVKADAVKHEGMFNVYEQDKRYFVEVPDNLLGRDIFVFVSLIRGAAMERGPRDMIGYGGDALVNQVVRFEKGPNDRLFLIEPRYRTLTQDTTFEMYPALKSSNLTAIAEGFDVKAKGEHSVIVDFTDLYKGDHPYFSLKALQDGPIRFGAYQADKSYPTTVSTFPNNVIFRSVRTYGPGKPDPKAKTKTKPQPTTWEVASSWYLLPEQPLQPRYADFRVGYFSASYDDYTLDATKAKKVAVARRWRLEPRPEDVEKYKRGELVEPEKPIVYYIDKNTPKYLQSSIKRGVEAWQPVFEKVGFKNAIQAKMEPVNDPDFFPEDARYSYISYKASPVPNAYGPHVADPRTGEIICSHVGLFHNVLDLARTWYFAQCAAVDPKAHEFPYSDEFMGTLMEYIVTHEIGHTLGLRHNFAGSYTFKLDEIRDRDFVKKYGHGATVMDYMRFNYAAQPEDKIDPEDLIPKLGDYDYFAIEWGYRYFPEFKDEPRKQFEYQRDWVTAQRKANPRVFFGTETDPLDPRFQAEDLSDNTLEADKLGMKTLKYIASNLVEWTKNNEDNTEIVTLWKAMVGQYSRYVNHAAKYIGGRYSDWALRSENGIHFRPVEKNKQQAAMEFLKEYVFAEQKWMLRGDFMNYFNYDVDAYESKVLTGMFSALLKKAATLAYHETLLGEEAYTVKNLTDDLYTIAFGKLGKQEKLSWYERTLQTKYVQAILNYLSVEDEGSKDEQEKSPVVRVVLADHLDKIAQELKSATSADALTRNHRAGLALQIEAWISGDKQALLK